MNLPALESLHFVQFDLGGTQLEMLQPDKLFCPQLSSLSFEFYHTSQEALAGDIGSPRCSLAHLPRLATLELSCFDRQAPVSDLRLPASLKHLTVWDTDGVDLQWLLLEAVKGIGSGAQLRSLTCTNSTPSSHPAWTPWGASSVARYRELAEQLRGLQDLTLHGSATTLLSAIGAVAGSAPDLTRLEFGVDKELDDLEIPPICSASLKSVTARYSAGNRVPPPPVILSFLPACTKLRDVRVGFCTDGAVAGPGEGTSIKIRCHCTSRRCIMPLDACAGLDDVGVRVLPLPPSSQGVQAYTVTFTCHAAGPKWGHVVRRGFL